ncbi:hypothetical protein Cfor_02008, partial [Coptotermes formosanus]
QFPEWLQGSFLRLGPGKFDIGDLVMNHWFDGYAVIYKFDIHEGKVTFTKRFLQSDAYKKAVAVGRPVFTEFGTKAFPDPCKNLFSRMMSSLVPDLTDNGAINIFTLEDAVYVASETNFLRRVDLVVDIVAFDSPEIIDKLFLKKLRKSEMDQKDPGYGCRFVLPLPKEKTAFPDGKNLVTLKTKATAEKFGDVIEVTPQILSKPGYELPTVSRNVFGKKYRYFYGAGMYDPGPFRNSLLKVDTETGDIKTWKENQYTYPGEVQFVPCPGSSSEDDGILLATVNDVRRGEPDFLLVLDAKSFTEIARAEVTVHVPSGIHDCVRLRRTYIFSSVLLTSREKGYCNTVVCWKRSYKLKVHIQSSVVH